MPTVDRVVLCVALGLFAVLPNHGPWTSSVRADDPPAAAAAPVHRVSPPGTFPADGRLRPPRTLRDGYHPWSPPPTLAEWEAERERIRTQLLVACGLWPLPEKTPLAPVIHGRVDRDDYTVDRVFFASRPGLYVTGSLYRPKGFEGPRPVVLNPHGHWADGRFYEAGEQAAEKEIASGAESLRNAARFPLQARMVQLARMGCIVFHYDMIGYADNGPLAHSSGFDDAEAELRSQNIFGLQTWNSLRALDFVAALPDVDPDRIAVTGASGGGTQTFVLCAIDPRPAVAFPAVMVSTAMQGGCVCENASLLRPGLNNVAFAACFAPKPLALSGANDWTIDIETRGLPELRQVWSLYNRADDVHAQCFPQFGHNYNRVARVMMYEWMNRHLQLGLTSPMDERDFVPLTRAEMTVFTSEHPRPADALPAAQLRPQLTDAAQLQYADLLERGVQNIADYQAVVRPALEVMLGGPAPSPTEIESETTGELERDGYRLTRGWCRRSGSREQIPWVQLTPNNHQGETTVWIDGRGKHALFDANGRPTAAVRRLLDQGQAVLSADVLLTGEYLPAEAQVTPPVHRQFAGYTYGYNRPLIAERARDILTVVALARRGETKAVHLAATREAGPWMLLARGLLADDVQKTQADPGHFSFAGLTRTNDPDFLPGALRYGGLGGLLAAAGPVKVEVAGAGEEALRELKPFQTLGGQLTLSQQRLTPARED